MNILCLLTYSVTRTVSLCSVLFRGKDDCYAYIILSTTWLPFQTSQFRSSSVSLKSKGGYMARVGN